MKTNLVLVNLLAVAALITGCGKKTENEKPREQKVVRPSEAEVFFFATKEVRRAVLENDLEALKKVLEENPDFNLNEQRPLEDGDTLLIKAIRLNFTGIRNFLLERGVDPGKASVLKETPIMVAVSLGRIGSVRVLLSYRVDLTKKDLNGDTALHMAIKAGNEEIMKLLLANGADPRIQDAAGRDCFTLAEQLGKKLF